MLTIFKISFILSWWTSLCRSQPTKRSLTIILNQDFIFRNYQIAASPCWPNIRQSNAKICARKLQFAKYLGSSRMRWLRCYDPKQEQLIDLSNNKLGCYKVLSSKNESWEKSLGQEQWRGLAKVYGFWGHPVIVHILQEQGLFCNLSV